MPACTQDPKWHQSTDDQVAKSDAASAAGGPCCTAEESKAQQEVFNKVKPAVEVVTPFAKIQLAASKRAAAQASGMSKDETYLILSMTSNGLHFNSIRFN